MSDMILKYKKLKAEYDLLVEICSPLYQIKYKLEGLEKYPLHAEAMAEGIARDCIQYLKSLEKRIDENERERKSVAATILKKDHGITLGEKIPYHHSRTGESGYLRTEEVTIYFRPDWDEDTFVVSGLRFKKDGKVGKITTSAYLRVLSGNHK